MPSAQEATSWIKLSVLSLTSIFFLFCIVVKTVEAEENVPDKGQSLCKELKPFNNLDDLLYQFYVNLDSDCLFKMPVEELEKIWQTKILTDDWIFSHEAGAYMKHPDFGGKPYRSENDAFYIRVGEGNWTKQNVFYIEIAEEYYKKHATLFPEDNYPKLLPEPLTQSIFMLSSSMPWQNEPLCPKKRWRYDLERQRYYWVNSDHTREMSLHGFCGVTGILIFNRPAPDSQNNKPK